MTKESGYNVITQDERDVVAGSQAGAFCSSALCSERERCPRLELTNNVNLESMEDKPPLFSPPPNADETSFEKGSKGIVKGKPAWAMPLSTTRGPSLDGISQAVNQMSRRLLGDVRALHEALHVCHAVVGCMQIFAAQKGSGGRGANGGDSHCGRAEKPGIGGALGATSPQPTVPWRQWLRVSMLAGSWSGTETLL